MPANGGLNESPILKKPPGFYFFGFEALKQILAPEVRSCKAPQNSVDRLRAQQQGLRAEASELLQSMRPVASASSTLKAQPLTSAVFFQVSVLSWFRPTSSSSGS